MDRDTYIQIARHLNDIDRLFEREAVGTVSLLEEWEPELAILAMEKLGSRESAARWFAAQEIYLGRLTPWEALAEGRADRIKKLLDEAVEHSPCIL